MIISKAFIEAITKIKAVTKIKAITKLCLTYKYLFYPNVLGFVGFGVQG